MISRPPHNAQAASNNQSQKKTAKIIRDLQCAYVHRRDILILYIEIILFLIFKEIPVQMTKIRLNPDHFSD